MVSELCFCCCFCWFPPKHACIVSKNDVLHYLISVDHLLAHMIHCLNTLRLNTTIRHQPVCSLYLDGIAARRLSHPRHVEDPSSDKEGFLWQQLSLNWGCSNTWVGNAFGMGLTHTSSVPCSPLPMWPLCSKGPPYTVPELFLATYEFQEEWKSPVVPLHALTLKSFLVGVFHAPTKETFSAFLARTAGGEHASRCGIAFYAPKLIRSDAGTAPGAGRLPVTCR